MDIYSNASFFSKLNRDFTTCGFDRVTQFGILFFMGININLDWQYTYPECAQFAGDNDEDHDFYLQLRTMLEYELTESSCDLTEIVDRGSIEKSMESYHYLIKHKLKSDMMDRLVGTRKSEWLTYLENEVLNKYKKFAKKIKQDLRSKFMASEFFLADIGNMFIREGLTEVEVLAAGDCYYHKVICLDHIPYLDIFKSTIEEMSSLFRAFMKYPISFTIDAEQFHKSDQFSHVLELGSSQNIEDELISFNDTPHNKKYLLADG